jgi:hypothetical protein
MRVPAKIGLVCAAFWLTASGAFADEIRLKDGKKLYGVIVAYEDNMFKVKTEFGFVLVEKDKIASIIPDSKGPTTPPAGAASAAKPSKSNGAKPNPVNKPDSDATSAETAAGNSAAADLAPAKAKLSGEPVRPSVPAVTSTGKVTAPAIKPTAGGGAAVAPANSAMAAVVAPKEPESPTNKEEVQGTLYTNFSHGFRMYKAPSWQIIEDARRALPNAIVAMGTSNESTLMVVGQEPSKDSLDVSANGVEKRLQEIYTNYRMLSRRKTIVGGAPAIEYKYVGNAEEHDWSGTLVVVARDKDVLTILGMTHADNDLIQIQENVIARAISSTDFNVH